MHCVPLRGSYLELITNMEYYYCYSGCYYGVLLVLEVQSWIKGWRQIYEIKSFGNS